jgi:hypothetical protein
MPHMPGIFGSGDLGAAADVDIDIEAFNPGVHFVEFGVGVGVGGGGAMMEADAMERRARIRSNG